jgi:REP element-mobilizing transposase RayT
VAWLAYHLSWTAYGTWLSGDERGWVQSGVPVVQLPDAERKWQAEECMAEEAVHFTVEQRSLIEQTILDHCRIRGWALHAVNVRSNHVHVVVSANRDASQVMDQFKAWCSRKLSDQAGLEKQVARKAGRRRWWTEGGSKKRIDSEEYLRNAIEYVLEKQE